MGEGSITMAIWKGMADAISELPLPKKFHVAELGSQELAYGPRVPAVTLYKELGCARYESIDGNRAGTVLHDLNLPLPDIGTFDLVTDFGTGEHIFNQLQVCQTIHSLTKVGGYISVIRPEQGYPGHCFYRTDECVFRDIAAANGYQILLLTRMNASRGSNIFVIYRRIDKSNFQIPQQGRYGKDLKGLMQGEEQ
jgi:hypothetical protein